MIPLGSELCLNCKKNKNCDCHCHISDLINVEHKIIYDRPISNFKLKNETTEF